MGFSNVANTGAAKMRTRLLAIVILTMLAIALPHAAHAG